MKDQEIKNGKKDAAPPCLKTGEILCRGCPGWHELAHALAAPDSMWRRYPVHCSALRIKEKSEAPNQES